MTTKKLRRPVDNICRRASPDARTERERMKKLDAAHDRGIPPAEHKTCAPQGAPEETIHSQLREIEAVLASYARLNPGISVITGIIDMARLTMFNKIITMKGGTRALELYLETTEKALALVGGMNGGVVDWLPLFRVANTSDECVMLIAGKGLTRRPNLWFNNAWKYLKNRTNLSDYRFIVDAEDGSRKVSFELDLYGLSQVLRNPDVLVKSHHSMVGPRRVKPDAKPGFLHMYITELQNKEIPFRGYLPPRFRGNGGLSEVRSPFRESLTSMGEERTDYGSFVDIKLSITSSEARALRHLVELTRKGYSEAYSRTMGIRGLNTYLGKAVTNTILTPISQAMGEIAGKVAVMRPLSSGYLRYWTELPPTGLTVRLIKEAIKSKVPRRGSPYMQLLSDPTVSVLDATEAKVDEVRCRFILQSLDKGHYEPWVLDATDSILNIIENVDPDVQDEIYAGLANGGRAVSEMDIRYMKLIRTICEKRRTIRDTEDLIWVTRMDDGLASDIKANQGDINKLENWLFDFSAERFKRIFLLLASRIQEEMKKH